MGDDLVVALILLADEIERVAQRRERRLDAGLRLAPFHLQVVDLALDVLEARLRLLLYQFRAAFRVAHDARAFLAGRVAHVVGHLLRADQRRLEAALELAMLAERSL